MKRAIVAILSGVLCSGTAQAAVTALSGPGDIATTFFNDFETVVSAGPVSFVGGESLSSAGSAASGVTTSGVNGLISATFPDTIDASLSTGYNAVGLFFGNDDTCCSTGFSAVLSVYDGAFFLGSVSVAANMNDFVDQFIGLSSTTAFDRVTIDYAGAGLFVFIDDFRLGAPAGPAVPEPATWAMLIAGFGLTGAAMRRRRTAAV